MTDGANARARYSGTVKKLAAALLPSSGLPCSFFTYHQPRGKCDAKALVVAAPMLRRLARLQENLSFTNFAIEKALLIVYKSKKLVWTLREDQVDEWKRAMGARIRAACRDVAQARRKSPMPAWARSLLDTPDGEAAEESDEEMDESAEDANEEEPEPARPSDDRAPLQKPAAADSQEPVGLGARRA
jgi:hypothetical protein